MLWLRVPPLLPPPTITTAAATTTTTTTTTPTTTVPILTHQYHLLKDTSMGFVYIQTVSYNVVGYSLWGMDLVLYILGMLLSDWWYLALQSALE